MAVTGFNRAQGTLQGRIQPTGFNTPEGDWALVLGSDTAGQYAELDVGDYVEWTQNAEFTASSRLFRVTASRFRPPTSMPAGHRWKFALRIDGVERARYFIDPGRTVDKVELAANVANLAAGSHTVALRLEVTS